MKLIILLPILVSSLFSSELSRAKECYEMGNIDCGIQYARILKKEKQNEEAATVFLDLSLKGSYKATRELSKFYIYGADPIKQDCKKGVAILLNSVDKNNSKDSIPSYMEISNIFLKGVCVEQSFEKAKKYKDIYMRKSKDTLSQFAKKNTEERNEKLDTN